MKESKPISRDLQFLREIFSPEKSKYFQGLMTLLGFIRAPMLSKRVRWLEGIFVNFKIKGMFRLVPISNVQKCLKSFNKTI